MKVLIALGALVFVLNFLIWLTDRPVTMPMFSVSPDEKYIAFDAVRRGKSGVYVWDVERQTTRYLGLGSAPAWVPQRDEVIVVRDAGLTAIKLDGSGERQLTDGQSAHDYLPSVDAAGEWVLFRRSTRYHAPIWTAQDAWRMPVAGGMPEQVTHESVAYGMSPRIFPDGERLAYVNSSPDKTTIHVYVADMSGKTLSSFHGRDPCPSPSGDLMTYLTSEGLLVSDLQGTDPRLLIAEIQYQYVPWNPIFSADGQHIYVRTGSPAEIGVLQRLRPDGTELTEVISAEVLRRPWWFHER
ncbi:MAG TPA: hypothetical protein DCZ72_13255 [Armatimonadetes bacterium]|nr:hypothetical protein [Armatimonadota bacterium]